MHENTKEESSDKIEKTEKLSRKISLASLANWSFLSVGVVALIFSVIYVSSILAFIGLGLVFWGAVLFYVSPEEYVKTTLLDVTTTSLLARFEKMLNGRDYKAVYLPPKYLKDFESNKVYLTTEKTAKLPPPEQIQQKENELFSANSNSILQTPPGDELVTLFENTLGTSFTKVDLRFLENNLPKLFIEDLEIAENMEIEIRSNKIRVKLENFAYKNISKELSLSRVVNLLGCPISSAIACALAKAAGKPVSLEGYRTSDEGRTLSVEYELVEE